MDPRRIPELSEAAARGAARKAAADSRQRSIQEAMSTSRGELSFVGSFSSPTLVRLVTFALAASRAKFQPRRGDDGCSWAEHQQAFWPQQSDVFDAIWQFVGCRVT